MVIRRLALGATVLALSACATKDASSTNTAASQGAVAQAGAPATNTFDPGTRTATIRAKEFAFDAPDTIPAGTTTFHLVNDGTTLHHVQIVRLDSGKTLADIAPAMKDPMAPPPAWMVFIGGPNAPNPGATSDALIDLTPGNYALLCLVDLPDHVPHFVKGMMHGLVVTAAPASANAAPAAPDLTVTQTDYAFSTDGAWTAGKHLVKVVNAGHMPHEVEMVKLAPGKTLHDLAAWIDKPNGPPPGDAIGGMTAQSPGTSMYFPVELTKGNYLLLCFLPDGKGKMHVDHGMVRPFTVN